MHLCCLKCTSVLDKSRIDDVEVDHCPRCGGLWLDHGEIERLTRKVAADVDKLKRLLAPRGGPPPVPAELPSTCPACTSGMKEVSLGPVRVDYCTRCKGIFLDRGELDAALGAVREAKATVPAIIAAAASEVPA